MKYEEFLKTKTRDFEGTGFNAEKLNDNLFDYQKDIVRWAIRKGRSCIFASTGLGKTIMQMEWARKISDYTGGEVLVLTPLAIAEQTKKECEKFNISLEKITIINYESLHKVSNIHFTGVVLDESSILKSYDSKYRTTIISKCRNTPYKLACTATPAPNDYMELGNHAEFVGAMTRNEMMAMFFVHDGGESQKWRLKGHAKTQYWDWVSSWAVMIDKPETLGYESTYQLPELIIDHQTTDSEFEIKKSMTLIERKEARKKSILDRCNLAASIVNQSDDQWLVWCDLNDESSMLHELIDQSVEVRGSQKNEVKIENMTAFTNGTIKALVTKPKIAGFGMNWQHCNNMIFVGLSDSFEQYFQAVRRCWRFGQKKPVNVIVITSKNESCVVENIKLKQKKFDEMMSGMTDLTKKRVIENIKTVTRSEYNYSEDESHGSGFDIYKGDSCEVMKKFDDESFDFSIFSPPFQSLYTYTNSVRDLGNSSTEDEFYSHFRFIINDLFRTITSGGVVAVHCQNIMAQKSKDGFIGIKDFRSDLIREFQKAGIIFHSEVGIWKNPVVEVTRTKALGLFHKTIRSDSSKCRMGMPDYLLCFKKPGERKPIEHTHDNFPVNLWQRYASPFWFDINQSDTLQRKSAKENNDEKHIAPLQISVIERALRLWSAPGDRVISPFMGIGSEGYVCLRMGRKFTGIELKDSYYECAKNNLHNFNEKVDPYPTPYLDADGKVEKFDPSIFKQKIQKKIEEKTPLSGQIELF